MNTSEGPVSARARNALAANNPEGLVRVAEGFERAGNLEGAYNLFAQALAAQPDLVSAKLGIARIFSRSGQTDQANAILKALATSHPDDDEIKLALVQAAIDRQAYAEALDQARPLIGEGRGSAPILNLVGRLKQVTGDAAGARRHFDQALVVDPQNESSLRNLAISFALEGQYETAVALVRRSMDTPTGAVAGQRSLALIYALSGQRQAAQTILGGVTSNEQAKKLAPLLNLLPTLAPNDQATLLMFDQLPVDAFRAGEER